MGNQTIYAGFWKRCGALFIDALILTIPSAFISSSIALNLAAPVDGILQPYVSTLIAKYISVVIAWLYFAIFESSQYQATLGKKVMGLYVTDYNGSRLTFVRASGRYFGKILSAILMGFGFLMAAFTSKKQALHDMLASCLVVRKSESSGTERVCASATGIVEEPFPASQSASSIRERRQYVKGKLHDLFNGGKPVTAGQIAILAVFLIFFGGAAVTAFYSEVIEPYLWDKREAQEKVDRETHGGRYDDSWTMISGDNHSNVHVEFSTQNGSKADFKYQTKAELARKFTEANPNRRFSSLSDAYYEAIWSFPQYKEMVAENNQHKYAHYNARKIYYRGSTIHIYEQDVNRYAHRESEKFPEPTRVIEGATDINVYRSGVIYSKDSLNYD